MVVRGTPISANSAATNRPFSSTSTMMTTTTNMSSLRGRRRILNGWAGVGRWVDHDPTHGRRAHLVDVQAYAVELEAFPLVRKAAELLDDVTCYRGGGTVPAHSQ